jgi:hypothetical protein
MRQIKTLKKDTDFTNLKLRKVGWDTYCKGISYDVYSIEDFYHSIGGRWGENNYWACPHNEIPTYDNLVEFSGEPCCWGILLQSNNYLKTKYDTEMRHNYRAIITRNDESFYTFGANNSDFALTKARQLLFTIQEHPIEFNQRYYEKDIINRKIYWREQPAIIKSYCIDGNLRIVPDGIKVFKKCSYNDNVTEDMDMYDDTDDDGGIAEDLFAPSIYWFRNKDYGKVE